MLALRPGVLLNFSQSFSCHDGKRIVQPRRSAHLREGFLICLTGVFGPLGLYCSLPGNVFDVRACVGMSNAQRGPDEHVLVKLEGFLPTYGITSELCSCGFVSDFLGIWSPFGPLRKDTSFVFPYKTLRCVLVGWVSVSAVLVRFFPRFFVGLCFCGFLAKFRFSVTTDPDRGLVC